MGRLLLLLAAALPLVGCEKNVVFVNCVTTVSRGAECEVRQAQGTAEVEACWDYEVTCDDGATVKAARTCLKVKDGGKAKATIKPEELEGMDRCRRVSPSTAAVSNLTLNGKPAGR